MIMLAKKTFVAVLTPSGFLVCRECLRDRDVCRQYGAPVIGKSGRFVYPGDTYSDEVCDICGKAVER